MFKSINQTAQEERDTSANEADRIRERHASIAKAWRTVAYNDGESACTVARLSEITGLPASYVFDVCASLGYGVR